MQCPDRSVAFGLSIVPFVRRHKQRVLVLERLGVIERVNSASRGDLVGVARRSCGLQAGVPKADARGSV